MCVYVLILLCWKLSSKTLIGQNLVFLPFLLNPLSLFSGLFRLPAKTKLKVPEADEDSLKASCFPDIRELHGLT